MTTLNIFQVEKNNDDIRKTILTNIIKMLTERKLLNYESLDKNIKNLQETGTDDYSYMLTVENNKNDDEKKIAIKIFNQKISGISKQSGISDFLNKYKDIPKIIIVKSINTKSLLHVANNYPRTEIFLENQLMVNLVDNVLVSKYELLERETDDYKNFCEEYKCKKRNIPKLHIYDPTAKYYGLKKGDIVRVIRPSETSGKSPFYRIVI